MWKKMINNKVKSAALNYLIEENNKKEKKQKTLYSVK